MKLVKVGAWNESSELGDNPDEENNDDKKQTSFVEILEFGLGVGVASASSFGLKIPGNQRSAVLGYRTRRRIWL